MTGGIVCSVATCKSNSKKAKQEGQFLRFFRFPKNPEVRKEWMVKCYRQDKWDAATKRICSKHFKPDDYEDKVKAELMNIQPKVLKKNAVPALFLLCNDEKPPIEKSKRMSRRKRKTVVDKRRNYEDKEIFSWQKSTYVPCDMDEMSVSEPNCEQSDDDVLLYDSPLQDIEDTQKSVTEEINSGVLEELKCNLCEQIIRGPFRYSCVQCYDFDLCGACEARGAHQMHYVLRSPGHKTISEVQSLIRVIHQALTADITVPVSHYSDELKMEIKEEAVERPESYPDADDPLSWDVKLETNYDSADSDTTLYADEEESPSKRHTLPPKNKEPIIIPFTSTSTLIQTVAINKNTTLLENTSSEILKTNIAVSLQTTENTTIRQPIASNLQLKERPLLLRQIQTTDKLNIQQTSNIETQHSSSSIR